MKTNPSSSPEPDINDDGLPATSGELKRRIAAIQDALDELGKDRDKERAQMRGEIAELQSQLADLRKGRQKPRGMPELF